MTLLARVARTTLVCTVIGYLLLLLTSMPCQAQQPPRWHLLETVTFRHVSAEQGLPVGAVTAVAEDARGLIWAASAGGLYRWDGHQARLFPIDDPRVQEDLRTLARAPDDSLWLGSSVGLTRLDPLTGQFTPVDTGRHLGAVVDIAFDRQQQHAWLARDGGISRLDLNDGSATVALDSGSTRVFQIRTTEDGSVWAATETGLLRRHANTPADAFERVTLPDVALDTRIASLAVARDGTVFVGSAREGLFRIDTNGQISRPYAERFRGEWIYSLAEIRPGVLWLGTYGQGLIELSQADGWRSIRHNRLVRQGLANDNVWSIDLDNANRVWVGTARGVSVHDPEQTAIRHVFGDTGSDSPIRNTLVRSVFEDRLGRLWLGLDQSGVDIIDPTAGRVQQFNADPEKPQSHLPRGGVEIVAPLNDASHLIGSNWGLYHAKDGQLQRIDAEGLPERQYVGAVAVDARGVLAGGTNGLWRLQRDDGRWQASRVDVALSDQRVSNLLSLPDGGTVVGTWAGVNWLDENDRLLAQTLQPGPGSPFVNGFVNSLRLGPEKRLWIASDAGLYRIDAAGADQSMVRLGAGNGLPSSIVRALEFDHQGRAWVATSKGLAVVDSKDLSVAAVATPTEGMMAPYPRNASTRTSEGELVFGGDGGITVVSPDRWLAEPIGASIAIVNVMIDDQRVPDASLGQSDTRPVVMPAGSTTLAVEFASLTYASAPPSGYRYRLHGFDTDWRNTDREHRTASYTSLTPGKYRLQVQSENGLGGWSEPGQTLHVQVLPTWYQHPLAHALGLLLIAGFLYGLFRWRTYRLHQRQQHLETVVAQRTQALEAATEALREKSAALEQASITDPLTDLRNRRFLDQHMPNDVAAILRRRRDCQERAETPPDMVFFLLDLDHFKRINDRDGHAAGDRVLKTINQRLCALFRESDYLVRWGGEEFLVVARDTSRAKAGEVAERLRQEIKRAPFDIGDGRSISLTCSIGAVAFPFDPCQPEAMSWSECIELADQALYAAKNAGRDTWVYVEATENALIKERAQRMRTDFYFMCLEGVLHLHSNRTNDSLMGKW